MLPICLGFSVGECRLEQSGVRQNGVQIHLWHILAM